MEKDLSTGTAPTGGLALAASGSLRVGPAEESFPIRRYGASATVEKNNNSVINFHCFCHTIKLIQLLDTIEVASKLIAIINQSH